MHQWHLIQARKCEFAQRSDDVHVTWRSQRDFVTTSGWGFGAAVRSWLHPYSNNYRYERKFQPNALRRVLFDLAWRVETPTCVFEEHPNDFVRNFDQLIPTMQTELVVGRVNPCADFCGCPDRQPEISVEIRAPCAVVMK
jgi:hypothetical protein